MRLLTIIAVAAFSLFSAEPRKPAPKAAPPKTLRIPFAPIEAGVKAADIKATLDNGKAARVLRVRTTNDDLLLLVVMDTVGEISLIDSARNALISQLRAMPQSTWVGLMRAQDGLQVVIDPTPDRDKFADALLSMPATGKAGLLDTVEMAARLGDSVAAKSPVRLAILYLTDSEVRNYREDFSNPVINSSDSRDLSRRFPEGLIREKVARLTDKLSVYQTPVFMVHLEYSSERLDQAYQSGLMQLAAATGGTATFCRSRGEVPDLVAQALDSVQVMSQAWVQLPPKAPRTVNLFLEVQDRSLSYRSRFVIP